jgi:SHS family lactate transporter-like MFS transporter
MSEAEIELTAGSSDRNAAVLAGFLGWTLDAFDFFIVTLCSGAIAATYKVDRSDITHCIFLTLIMRPVGAFLFGLVADRYGRRRPMMYNLVFFSTVSVLSGLAPTFHLFVVCRILFGIGMGGEWGVGASLAMEKVPPRLRGLLSGLLQEGYSVGALLASAAYFFLSPHLPPGHQWQPLFWVGGLPALLAFYIRFQVRESAVWQATKKDDWSRLGSTLIANWKLFLSIFVLMLMMNLSSHGTQDLFPGSLRQRFNLTATQSPGKVAGINAFSHCGAILGGLVVGYLSDRIGRRWAMIGAFICATLLVPLWAYAPNLGLLLTGAFFLQFMVQGAWGVIPAHITELSPDSVRGFLPGFAYQCGAAACASVLEIQEALGRHIGLTNAMAASAATIFPIAAFVVWLGRERTARAFGHDEALAT